MELLVYRRPVQLKLSYGINNKATDSFCSLNAYVLQYGTFVELSVKLTRGCEMFNAFFYLTTQLQNPKRKGK